MPAVKRVEVQLAKDFNPPGVWRKYSEFKSTYSSFAEHTFDYMSIEGYHVTIGHSESDNNTLFIFGLMAGNSSENAIGISMYYKKGNPHFKLGVWINGDKKASTAFQLGTDAKDHTDRIDNFLGNIAPHILNSKVKLPRDKRTANKIAKELVEKL